MWLHLQACSVNRWCFCSSVTVWFSYCYKALQLGRCKGAHLGTHLLISCFTLTVCRETKYNIFKCRVLDWRVRACVCQKTPKQILSSAVNQLHSRAPFWGLGVNALTVLWSEDELFPLFTLWYQRACFWPALFTLTGSSQASGLAVFIWTWCVSVCVDSAAITWPSVRLALDGEEQRKLIDIMHSPAP